MLIGKIEYGTWNDGSSIYKDSNGYYIVTLAKKYLKNWKPPKDNVLLALDSRTYKWKDYDKNDKYKNRSSPHFPANEYCGKKKKGYDGNMYISMPDKNGVCKWKKIK